MSLSCSWTQSDDILLISELSASYELYPLSVDKSILDNNSGYTNTSDKVCSVPIVINESLLVILPLLKRRGLCSMLRKDDHG